MSDTWRMAFMLDALDGDRQALEQGLIRAAGAIRARSGDAHLRMGVLDGRGQTGGEEQGEYAAHWRTVDAAVEITVAAERARELEEIARAMRDILPDLARPSSIEVMAGPLFPMVEQRPGETFLSLAFKRHPRTTSEAFQNWWRFQHAPIAIPIMGEVMLAYDQVHVDQVATHALALAFGVEPVAYDAYDNLTWARHEDFFTSTSDEAAMAQIFADEVGRIDNNSRRNALMRRIG